MSEQMSELVISLINELMMDFLLLQHTAKSSLCGRSVDRIMGNFMQ